MDPYRTLDQLLHVLTRLSLVSHANSSRYGGRSSPDSAESIGGRRPTGALDWRGDREDGFRQKSAEHYWRQLFDARSVEELEALLVEARKSLEAWHRAPLADGQMPPRSSPQWKRWVVQSDESAVELARLTGVSERYIRRVRADFGREVEAWVK